MTLGLSVDQLGFAVAGFLGVMVIALSWSLSKRNSYDRGYGEGYHDRQHWETDQEVKAKLQK